MTSDESSSCTSIQLLIPVLDGAVERAVLVSDDGKVLHMNGAASHFLYKTSKTEVTDFLECKNGKDWRTVEQCHIVKWDGVPTRSERKIQLVKLQPCSCCSKQYYTVYICSKHERVREVVDHALDPVFTINEKGIIVTANHAASELFGYTEDEMLGHSLRKLCGGGHSEHHDRYVKQYLETGVKKVIGKKHELLGKKKDGTEFACEIGVSEISDVSSGNRYFCGYVKDLTYIKQHEAELEELNSLAQGMINASFDGMFEINEKGIIKLVNDAACSMFGYTRDEFLGGNISMICGDGHGKSHDGYLARYLESSTKRVIGRKRQVKARRKDGSEFEVELGVQEVVLATGKRAFCGFIRDVTAQKNDKRALRKQQQIMHGKFFGAEEDS